MAWAKTLVEEKYACPRCNAAKKERCHAPTGRAVQAHKERWDQMTRADWKQCSSRAYTFAEIFNRATN